MGTYIVKHIALVIAAAVLAISFTVVLTTKLAGGEQGYRSLLGNAALPDGTTPAMDLSDNAAKRLDSLMEVSIRNQAFPGAAVSIGRANGPVLIKGYGYFTYDSKQAVTPTSQFDLASLTKVIATTTAVMKLYEEGRLDLDAPVASYLPEFSRPDRDKITVRQLLTHSAGLIPFRPYHTLGLTTREQVIEAILAEPLDYKPGTQVKYSDHGMILMALIVERITGDDFATWTREHIFEPLGMLNTGFRPVGQGGDNSGGPTEFDHLFRKRLVQGEVHDETAYLLGGTAGHAGLFSTAEDLTRFARMLLNNGRVGTTTFLKPETIKLFTTRVTNLGEKNTRALGWDTRSKEGYSSAGQLFGPQSFGHTGFTGTSLWIDPDAGIFAILLTNRVYPTRDNSKIGPVRADLADLTYRTLVSDTPTSVSASATY